MLKSLAKAACSPSFPTIPIPTSAHYIMPTSFPLNFKSIKPLAPMMMHDCKLIDCTRYKKI